VDPEEFNKLIEKIETEKFRFGQLRSLWFSIEKRIQCGRRKKIVERNTTDSES